MPEGARLLSIEFNADNAAIARRIWDHAGSTTTSLPICPI
jgi:predicted O-methyltransferase YrrM